MADHTDLIEWHKNELKHIAAALATEKPARSQSRWEQRRRYHERTVQALEAQGREILELQDVLRHNGFVECDIAACNCGSWHARYGWPERFREIDDATRDEERNGERLLARVNRIVARLAEAEALLETAGAKIERRDCVISQTRARLAEAEALLRRVAANIQWEGLADLGNDPISDLCRRIRAFLNPPASTAPTAET